MQCVIGRLPTANQERLDPLIKERAFRKSESLEVENTVATTVRTIKLGTILLTRQGPDQQARPVALSGRGHLLGMWSLVGNANPVGAESLSAVRVCELPTAALRQQFDQSSVLAHLLQTQMAREVALLADWAQLMRLRGLPRQLVAALILLAREQGNSSVQLPSQVALAHLLGASRESVARALKQIEESGHLRRIDRWHGELTSEHRQIFQTGTGD